MARTWPTSTSWKCSESGCYLTSLAAGGLRLRTGTHPLAHRAIFVADGGRANQAFPKLPAGGMPESRVMRIRLRRKTCGGPGGLDSRAIVRMNRLEPAVAGMCIPGLAGVVLPGRLQDFERSVLARLPWHVGEQLGERAQTFFPPAQLLVVDHAFDEIGGQPSQDVEQAEVALRRHVRNFPVRRDHAHELAAARQQWSGLRRTDSGREQLRLVGRSRHERGV